MVMEDPISGPASRKIYCHANYKMMYKRSLFQIALFIFFFITTAVPTLAKGPMERIKETSNKIIAILADPSLKASEKMSEKIKMIREIVNERFDWEEFSRRALAQHWNTRTKKEKKEFIALFGRLLEKIYKSRVTDYLLEKVKVYYDKESVKGRYGIVKVRIVTPFYVKIPVIYRVVKNKDDWFVYDISVKGISLVHNYRTQFREILRNSSFEELIKMLEKKLVRD